MALNVLRVTIPLNQESVLKFLLAHCKAKSENMIFTVYLYTVCKSSWRNIASTYLLCQNKTKTGIIWNTMKNKHKVLSYSFL